MTIEGLVFSPAVGHADVLTEELIGKLESEAQDLLELPIDPPVKARIEMNASLFEQVDPQNRSLRPLTDRLERARKQEELQDLWAGADRGMSSQELSGILRDMQNIDPEHDLTADVRVWQRRRLDQERTFADGIADFEARSLNGLSEAITEYERTDLQSATAEKELAGLEAARAWLVTFFEARDYLDSDLDQVGRLLDELRAGVLPPKFRESAKRNLGLMTEWWNQESLRRGALDLIREINRLCTTLQLGKAEKALAELHKLGAEGLDPSLGAAREQVATLREWEADRKELESEYTRFRGRLQSVMLRDARRVLERLVLRWELERKRLTDALEIEELGEHRLRRAILNMRLGDFNEALSDAKRLPESENALLLSAQARFALARENPSEIKAALDDIKRAIALPGQSARALHLRGVYRYQLLDPDAADPADLAEALGDLANAGNLGLVSADASYHMAMIHNKLEHAAEAIRFATKALNEGFTEAGIVTAFGGIRRAVETDGGRRFRCDTFYTRAKGHKQAGDHKACLRDCTAAVNLDPGFVWGYFLRSWANLTKGQWDDAEADLLQVTRRIPADAKDPNLRELRQSAMELLEDIRGTSDGPNGAG
jgi:hypothetical protein